MNDTTQNKRYEGTPEAADWQNVGDVDVWTENARHQWIGHRLPLFLDECNHSPTGFAWNYGGSGPAQLAYAILRDFSGSQHLAQRLHQAFKRDAIATLAPGAWTIEGDQVAEWIEAQDKPTPAPAWPRAFPDSSAIGLVDYDAETLILTVTFTSGTAWDYFDVPGAVADELAAADSVGKFYHHNIRGQFEGEKVEQTEEELA